MNAWISTLHKRIGASIQEYKDDSPGKSANDSIPSTKRMQKMYVLVLTSNDII